MTADPAQQLGWLTATLASDAAGGVGVLDPLLVRALRPGARVVAPALAVSVSRDDNRPLRDVAATPGARGAVVVVGGAALSRTACIGDLLARELLAAGVRGLVTDGLVRDSAEIAALGLPVWCRGTTPTASAKTGPGRVGGSVAIAGALVCDGDLVVADDDGVVVWPAAEVARLTAAAQDKQSADERRLAELERT